MARPQATAGDIFGRHYRVLHPLGKGGMGEVYLVEDLRTPGRKVALKSLSGIDPVWLAGFQSEFSLLAATSHPNIVPVFDYGLDEARGSPFYTAEWIRGEPLSQKTDPWSEKDLTDLIVQLLRALHFLHGRGILHGDIKPANILQRGEGADYLLVDFGVARSLQAAPSEFISGTVKFMAPEQFAGTAVDERSDLFSLGATIFRLATRAEPFPTNRPPAQSMRQFRSDLSPLFDDLVLKLIEWNPDARFRSADDVMDALRRTLNREDRIEAGSAVRPRTSTSFFIGRDTLLGDALTAVETSNVAIEGALGLGKTRFARELQRRLQLKGWSTTFFSPSSPEARAISILEQLARDLLPRDLNRPSEQTLWIARWLSNQRNEEKRLSQVDEAGDAFDRIVTWLIDASSDSRHVLMVDDVETLSKEERDLFASFLFRLESAPETKLRVVLCGESDFPVPAGLGEIYWVHLDPLQLEDIKSYFLRLQTNAHPSVVQAVHEKTGGSPLLVEEVIRRLQSEKTNVRESDAIQQVRTIEVGREVRDIFRERMVSLPAQERESLLLLALIQSPLPVRFLPSPLPESLYALSFVRPTVVAREPCVVLSQATIGSILQEGLTPAARREVHSEAASRLVLWRDENPTAVADRQLALHFLQSNSPEEGLPYLETSLSLYSDLHGNREAIELLDVAAPLLQDLEHSSQTQKILSMGAEILARVGRYEESLEILDRLLAVSTDEEPILLRRVADIHLKQRDFEKVGHDLNLAEKKVSALPVDRKNEEISRLRSIGQIMALFQGKADLVEKLGIEIEEMGQRTPLRERILSLAMRGHVARQRGDLPRARKRYEAALKLADENRHRSFISMAYGSLALVAKAEGHSKEARDFYKKAVEAAEAASDLLLLATHRSNVGLLLEEEGEYVAALDAYDRAALLFRRVSNQAEFGGLLYRRGLLLQQLYGGVRGQKDLRDALISLSGAGHLLNLAYCKLAIAGFETYVERARALANEAESTFREHKDRYGLREVTLLRCQRRWTDDLPDWTFVGTPPPQNVRLIETLVAANARSPLVTELLLKEIEVACEKQTNHEWLARVFLIEALWFKNSGEPVRSRLAAESAMKIFYRLGAPFGEKDKADYLSLRGIELLRGIVAGTGAKQINKKDEAGMNAETESSSRRLAQSASPDLWATLWESIKAINMFSDLLSTATALVDAALVHTGGERAFLVVKKGDDFDVLVARNIDHHWIREAAGAFSRSVVKKVLANGIPIQQGDLASSAGWGEVTSIVRNRTTAFLCVPVKGASGWTGALYVDRVREISGFSAVHIALAEALAEFTAQTLEKANLLEEIKQREARIENLNRQLEIALGKAKEEVKETASELMTTRGVLALKERDETAAKRFPEIVGKSAKFREILETVEQLAESDAAVHIYGESGTGKELVAQAIHARGVRKDKAFVAVNCGAIPPDLFESHFFGHLKGSFTGGNTSKVGFFVTANGGTLFLDEIADLPLPMQGKLLRVLSEGKVRPIGSESEIPISVRVISASNRDLQKQVAEGTFREDLFYRLHVVRIELPPLRERVEDIAPLAQRFLEETSKREGIKTPLMADDVMAQFVSYPWPGNIRQLKNEIERVIAVLPKKSKGPTEITASLFSLKQMGGPLSTANTFETLSMAQDQVAREMITEAMRAHKGNKSQVAKVLGLDRSGLRKMMKRLNISSA